MRIHLMEGDLSGNVRVVVHAPTPAGANAAGVPWSTALKNSGRAVSTMPAGTQAGQITNNEQNNVTAGTLIEAPFMIFMHPDWTAEVRAEQLNLRAAEAVQDAVNRMTTELNWFGLTVE